MSETSQRRSVQTTHTDDPSAGVTGRQIFRENRWSVKQSGRRKYLKSNRKFHATIDFGKDASKEEPPQVAEPARRRVLRSGSLTTTGMEMALDNVADGKARDKREGGGRERAWSRLAHAVVRDARLNDRALVAVAIRSTYADDASDFGLSAVTLKRAVRGGFGRDVAERTIKAMQALGWDGQRPKGRRVLRPSRQFPASIIWILARALRGKIYNDPGPSLLQRCRTLSGGASRGFDSREARHLCAALQPATRLPQKAEICTDATS